MIKLLKGRIIEKAQESVVLEVNGIGFEVLVDQDTLNRISTDEECFLYTALVWGDDPKIYGFDEKNKRELFLNLIKVSKLGPRTALKIISNVEVDYLVSIIQSGDVESLSKIPGIGKKTAERIVTELKDSLNHFPTSKKIPTNVYTEALEALKALGFTHKEAAEALESVANDSKDIALIIKEALNALMMKK